MTVTWSKRAQNSYLHTLEFILKKWTLKEGEAFENKVFSFINVLSKNKELCPASKTIGLRKCLISKQTSLVYKLSGNTIIILAFVDNRSNHKY